MWFIVCSFLSEQAIFARKLVASYPFQMSGSFIILQAKINNSNPLYFILDSGVKNAIITELGANDEVLLNYKATKTLQGLGGNDPITTLLSDSNTIQIGKIKLFNKDVFVLPNGFFNLSQELGTKINGIIGYDFFTDYIVQIDYTNKRLKFYRNQLDFKPPKGYQSIKMNIESQKMFIYLNILETDSAHRKIKMLIDTGAELTAWFQTISNKSVKMPEKSVHGRIGEGLSGEITGIFARVPQLCIANFCFFQPIVVFLDSSSMTPALIKSDRDGTIGGQLLKRFNIIIDTHNQNFYFKPNYNFKKPFRYNIAGIEINQTNSIFPEIEISNIWNGSPAQASGLEEGDIIKELNNIKVYSLTLTEIRDYFEKPSKKPLLLLIDRKGKHFKVKINMYPKI
ncbi:MAG: aspartyl protease family protein [Paludibacteraceae bacterium]|nr:aspartyl protease family protein [Paludibacteraceae bacterium]